MRLCENCGIGHSGEYASGRFCSSVCSRGFSTKSKRSEINSKVSKSLAGKNYLSFEKRSDILKERWKNMDPESKDRHRQSFSIAAKARWKNDDYRKKMKSVHAKNIPRITEAIRRKVNNGEWKGWAVNRNRSSYAEEYFERYFDSLGIKYRREVKIDRFFVDFLFENNIVLEVDGKQHDEIVHRAKDESRDKILAQLGYRVYRIKWKNINSEVGRTFVHEQTKQFMSYLK